MKSIENIENIENKCVILRLDLNVPIKNGKITDANRIDKVMPTLEFLLKKKAKIIIISHIGRPKGKIIKELSLELVSLYIKSKIKKEVSLLKENIFNLNKEDIFKNSNDELVLLENIRFYPEEEANDDKFSKKLASLGEIYVNDAFSCSHRDHASVSKITNYIPSYSGIQINAEVNALNKITSEIKKPITCIIGGSKISSKINIIKNLIPKFNSIIIVGAMANNIFKYKGLKIGNSIYEKNIDYIIKEIFIYAEKNNCKIYFPKDVKIGKKLNDESFEKDFKDIEDDDMILDVGSKTLVEIKRIIDDSSTILWNGPLGYFENENFSLGSSEVAKYIANRGSKIFSVVGGGDTVALINSLNIKNKFNFVSTAGGAFLEYLEGKVLPGIKALN
ncbi:phosphoglycerate kinase [Candidatus Pelagibacter sp.]|nr:phosphoglycerate kinase [Candidatus Pelagibacter sp.]